MGPHTGETWAAGRVTLFSVGEEVWLTWQGRLDQQTTA